MSFAENRHPVGDPSPGGEHEPFRISIRARTSRRNLHGLDAASAWAASAQRHQLSGIYRQSDLGCTSLGTWSFTPRGMLEEHDGAGRTASAASSPAAYRA